MVFDRRGVRGERSHVTRVTRVPLVKRPKDATSTGLGQNQAEDIAPFTDKKIAYFFLAVTEDELTALDEAAMLHLPLPQGGYASVRALYRLAAYQAGSCDYGMRGFIDNVRRRLNRPALAVTEVPSGMVKDVVLPKYRVPEF